METLEKLFGSAVRAKLLKLFLMNPEARFSSHDGARQTRVRTAQFLHEARQLRKLQILKSAWSKIEGRPQARGRRRSKPRTIRREFFFVNKDFPLFPELRHLMLKSAPLAKGQLASKIKRLGNVKLAILAGVFIDQANSRADLLLVADGIRKTRMKSFIQRLEAEVGKELNYVAMSSQEFKYRRDMYDRFLRDMLEFPHQTVINKLGV